MDRVPGEVIYALTLDGKGGMAPLTAAAVDFFRERDALAASLRWESATAVAWIPAVGMLVASGPVGWGVALIASALGGFFAQEAGKAVSKVVFDQYGQKLDLVSGTSLGRFCS